MQYNKINSLTFVKLQMCLYSSSSKQIGYIYEFDKIDIVSNSCGITHILRYNKSMNLRLVLLLIISFSLASICVASPFKYKTMSNGYRYIDHAHNEAAYQYAWCKNNKGTEEYQNKDFTRVDCLTNMHAVEFDFANKWAECVGQAEHYSLMTGKRGKCVLILDGKDWKKQLVYYERVKALGKVHNFDVEYITDDILNIDKGVCLYNGCKCHRKHKEGTN